MVKVLDEILSVEGDDLVSEEFIKMVREIKFFSSKVDFILDILVKVDLNWFVGIFFKMIC